MDERSRDRRPVIAGFLQIEVIQVYPTDDYKVYLYFTDGKVKLFDAKELVNQGIFQQLKDIDKFREK